MQFEYQLVLVGTRLLCVSMRLRNTRNGRPLPSSCPYQTLSLYILPVSTHENLNGGYLYRFSKVQKVLCKSWRRDISPDTATLGSTSFGRTRTRSTAKISDMHHSTKSRGKCMSGKDRARTFQIGAMADDKVRVAVQVPQSELGDLPHFVESCQVLIAVFRRR
jgi:hypothetical protein